MEKSKRIVGFIRTTTGGSPVEMTRINLECYKTANSQTFATMGFKFVYGLTQAGEIVEFIRAGAIRKKDLALMKDLGVVEAVSHGCFSPKKWKVDGGEMQDTAHTIEVGRDTSSLLDRWAMTLV